MNFRQEKVVGGFQVGSGFSPEAVALALTVQCKSTAHLDQIIFLSLLDKCSFEAWELVHGQNLNEIVGRI